MLATMKFGRSESVEGKEFTLPMDHPLTQKVFSSKPRQAGCKVYVGCPVWAESKMLGIVYPKGTKASEYLSAYARQFNAIELNATGYGTPSGIEVQGWISSVGIDFRFCPKVPRQISHTNPIGKNAKELQAFLGVLKVFGNNLGPTLLQLSPHFSPDRVTQLWDLCDKWNPRYSLQLELRHADWFYESATFDPLAKELRRRKIGLVITDVTDRRDVLHQCLTASTAFVRFDGHDLHPTDFKRLDDWAIRISTWIERGLHSLYFFVHTPQKHLNPYLADYFIERLNIVAGLAVKRPTILRPYQP